MPQGVRSSCGAGFYLVGAHNWHRAREMKEVYRLQRPGAFSRGFAVNLLHKSALNRHSTQAQFIRGQ